MRRLIVAAALLGASVLSLPGAPRKVLDWRIEKIEVEGLGDSVAVRLRWSFLDGEVDPSRAMVFAPSLRNGSHVASLRPVAVYGSKAARKADVLVASGNRGELPVVDLSRVVTVVTEDVLPRRDWMDTVKVVLQVSDWTRGGGLVLRSTSQRATFVRPAAPPPPQFGWTPLVPLPGTGATRTVTVSSPVVFRPGAQKFDAELTEGSLADSLSLFLTKVKALSSTRRYSVVSSSLEVTVPPSGKPKEAEKLSKARVASIYSYLQRGGAFRISQPVRRTGGEDWEGVSAWFASSRYSDDARIAEILSLRFGGEYAWDALRREKPAAMEELLRSRGEGVGRVTYSAVVRSPELRSGSFVREVYDVVPEFLVPHDFWVLACDYSKGSTAWVDVILNGARMHPEDPRLNYDAAMSLMDAGAVDAAVPFLRHAGASTDEGRYAMAVWLYRKGRYGESLEILDALKDRSVFYRSVWEGAAPFMDWYDGYVFWEKLLL